MKKKSRYSYYGRKNKKNSQDDIVAVKASVCIILVVIVFVASKINSPRVESMRNKLGVAVSENIEISDFINFGEKSIQTIKEISDIEEIKEELINEF